MPYATLQQLTDRFGEHVLLQLTDRAIPPSGVIDAAVVERAQADADAMIDGYLAGRYRLPLAAVPALVADLALVIAIYKLHVFAPDPKIKDDYDQALKTLRDISTGVIRLDVEGVEPAASGNTGVQFTDRERPMTPENMKGFI